MREGNTRTETWRVGAPLSVGPVTLLPIERVVVRSHRGDARLWISAAKEPFALVVRDAGGIRVIGTDVLAVTLEQLRESIPGLDALLAST
jgi:hypothetical protein